MSWQQIKDFDVTTTAPPGWCLNHVQRGFDAGWAGSTATDGWNRAQFKHTDENYPDGVWVPVWFAMKGEPAGHVVAYKKGFGLYSASDNDNEGDFHPSIKHLMDYYGGRLTLRGWSEDLNGTRVVQNKEDEEVKIGNSEAWKTRINQFMQIMHLRSVDDNEFQKNFVGRDLVDTLIDVVENPRTQEVIGLAQLGQKAKAEGWSKPGDGDKKLQAIKDALK